jgi:hypothetical protein
VVERHASANADEKHHQQNQKLLSKGESDDMINQDLPPSLVLKRIGELEKQAAVAHNLLSSR